jgi:hypothetical protein
MYRPGLVWAVLCPVLPGLGFSLGLNHVQPWAVLYPLLPGLGLGLGLNHVQPRVGLGCFVSSPPWFGVRFRAESCTALG